MLTADKAFWADRKRTLGECARHIAGGEVSDNFFYDKHVIIHPSRAYSMLALDPRLKPNRSKKIGFS